MSKIICGDTIREMENLESNSVDVIITSPPYNLKNSTGNGMKDGRGGKWSKAKLMEGYNNHDDNMSHNDYVVWIRDCLKEMFRVLKPTGAIFFNHKFRVQGGLMQNHEEMLKGFNVRQMIIWQRAGGINFNQGYFLPTYEVIYVMPKIAKGKNSFKLKQGGNKIGDVWKINQERNNPHPAPFPKKLVDNILQSCVGNLVLDPFAGSGTVAIAAIDNGWDYICIDNSPEYCSQINERISLHSKD
jgi:modification methylase